MKKLFVSAIACGLFLVIFQIYYENQCENHFFDTINSPDGDLSVFVFSRNCGATTGDNFQLSVAKSGSVFEGVGNVLIMDKTGFYSSYIKPRWESSRDLIVIIPKGARVFKKSEKAGGVSISYVYRE